jgi:diguanylate cyclase (GGDEF)-like protein/PAS domain S-box-containing protein
MLRSRAAAVPARRAGSLLAAYQARLIEERQRDAAALSDIQALKLARMDALMHKIVDATFDGILTIDAVGTIETANGAAARIFGRTVPDLQGLPVACVIPEFAALTAIGSDASIVGRGHAETIAVRANGDSFPADIAVGDTMLGNETMLVAVVRDITELREQQRALEYQALHDALTGLPNRVLLGNRIEHALAVMARHPHMVALLLLDLDRFKEVNDTLGHHIGDLLLKDLGARLRETIRPGDTVARLGGDEFAILLPHLDSVDQAMELAERILSVFREPFPVENGMRLDVGCSIGVAISPTHGQDPARLMQSADVAMYAAKEGPEKAVLYDPKKDTNSVRQLTLSTELRQAIAHGHLTLEFQPQLDLQTRSIRSVEALARWRHPRLGYVPPMEFITHAEQVGMISELTRWTLDCAMRHIARWQAGGLDLRVSLNISAKMLQDSRIADQAIELLAAYRINPSLLCMEITESALVLEPEASRANVNRLAEAGVMLSIDDFGTGYSSLSLLKQLPLQEMKIDKSFVFGMLTEANDQVIVRSTIDLAHNLGMTVVAEGVETLEHVEALAKLGCDSVQGFFISPALSSDMLIQWLTSTPWTAARRAA